MKEPGQWVLITPKDTKSTDTNAAVIGGTMIQRTYGWNGQQYPRLVLVGHNSTKSRAQLPMPGLHIEVVVKESRRAEWQQYMVGIPPELVPDLHKLIDDLTRS